MTFSSASISKVAVIGAGSWGTTIALVIGENRNDVGVTMWAYEKSVVASINSRHENTDFLPGIPLPHNLTATGSIRECMAGAQVIILATPSKAVYDISQKMGRYLSGEVHLGFLSKGFCKIQDEVFTISQTLAHTIPQISDRIVAISGPSHAEEVSAKFHTCLNVAGTNAASRRIIADLIRNDYLQCRENDDIIGVELGGTLKNPAAVAAGMISVLPRCGDNLAGALMSEALKEMMSLARLFKLKDDIMIDISGLGDLVATALSDHSRNRRFGRDIAKQLVQKGTTLRFLDRILLKLRPHSVIERMSKKLNYLAEGAYAIEPLIELADRHNISIPVYRSLYEVLLNKKDPRLLIETIKDPEKFDELYRKTKIHLTEGKSGLEKISGKVFRGAIIQKALAGFLLSGDGRDAEKMEKTVASLKDYAGKRTHIPDERAADELRSIREITPSNYNVAVKNLAVRYADEIVDSHFSFIKWLYFLFMRKIGIHRRGDFDFDRDVHGNFADIIGIERSDNLIYVSTLTAPGDYIYPVSAIVRYNLPFPRFLVSATAVRNRLHEFIIKYSGGFIVDPAKLSNPLYVEVLKQYILIMLEHGVPVMLFPGILGKAGGGAADTEGMFELIVESLYTNTTEIYVAPISILGGIKGKGSHEDRQVHFRKPFRLSEFTKAPYADDKVSYVIRMKWEQAVNRP